MNDTRQAAFTRLAEALRTAAQAASELGSQADTIMSADSYMTLHDLSSKYSIGYRTLLEMTNDGRLEYVTPIGCEKPRLVRESDLWEVHRARRS